MKNKFWNEPLDISTGLWSELIEDKNVTHEKDLEVLSLVYRSKNHEMRASDIASQVGARNHGAINLQIYHFSRRVLEKTGVNPSWMKNEQHMWWHVPFLGYRDNDGRHFPWIMREELVEAFDKILGSKETEITSPDELPPNNSMPFIEGAGRKISVNRYERSKKARDACVAHYGTCCVICGFNFEQVYGPIGKGKIVVHHLIPQSYKQDEYVVDPVHDLRPVCPNCHLIIHAKTEPFTIDEVKGMIYNSPKMS